MGARFPTMLGNLRAELEGKIDEPLDHQRNLIADRLPPGSNPSGGKSAATGLGVLLAMAWPVGLGTALVFAVVLALSQIVSLSSIAGALASIALMQVYNQPQPYVLLAVAGGLYVILKHKTNIQHLIAGTEPRIGKKHSEIS